MAARYGSIGRKLVISSIDWRRYYENLVLFNLIAHTLFTESILN